MQKTVNLSQYYYRKSEIDAFLNGGTLNGIHINDHEHDYSKVSVVPKKEEGIEIAQIKVNNDIYSIKQQDTTYTPSSTIPPKDTAQGKRGDSTEYARADHAHPKSDLYAEATHVSNDKGTSNTFGHVKVSDNISQSAGEASDSVVASSKAVTDVNSKLESRTNFTQNSSITNDTNNKYTIGTLGNTIIYGKDTIYTHSEIHPASMIIDSTKHDNIGSNNDANQATINNKIDTALSKKLDTDNVINNYNGGVTKALSAEMGKDLDERINGIITNNLGPNLSTNHEHTKLKITKIQNGENIDDIVSRGWYGSYTNATSITGTKPTGSYSSFALSVDGVDDTDASNGIYDLIIQTLYTIPGSSSQSQIWYRKRYKDNNTYKWTTWTKVATTDELPTFTQNNTTVPNNSSRYEIGTLGNTTMYGKDTTYTHSDTHPASMIIDETKHNNIGSDANANQATINAKIDTELSKKLTNHQTFTQNNTTVPNNSSRYEIGTLGSTKIYGKDTIYTPTTGTTNTEGTVKKGDIPYAILTSSDNTAYTGTITGLTEYYHGFTFNGLNWRNATNSANATINLNNLGAKPIFYKGRAIAEGELLYPSLCTFMYVGSNWSAFNNGNGCWMLIDKLYKAGTGLTLSGSTFSLTDASNYIKKSSTTGYIKNDGTIGTIANNLETTTAGSVLDATQGKALKTAVDGKAPTSHASTATTYGVATTANYGHTKIVQNLTTNDGNGLALGAGQGKALKDKYDEYITKLSNNELRNNSYIYSFAAGNNNPTNPYVRLFTLTNTGNSNSNHIIFELIGNHNNRFYAKIRVDLRRDNTSASSIKITPIQVYHEYTGKVLDALYYSFCYDSTATYFDIFRRTFAGDSFYVRIYDAHNREGTITMYNPVPNGTETYPETEFYSNNVINNKIPKTLHNIEGTIGVFSNYGDITTQIPNTIIEAKSFKKKDGTSSQFLKADGSVDNSAYVDTISDTITSNPGTKLATVKANTTTKGTISHPKTLSSALSTESLYKITANTDGHITKGTAVTIDTTAENNANNLITSQAVYNGLNSHTHGLITNDGKIGNTANKILMTTTDGAISTTSFGTSTTTTANYVVGCNDSRLSNKRDIVIHSIASALTARTSDSKYHLNDLVGAKVPAGYYYYNGSGGYTFADMPGGNLAFHLFLETYGNGTKQTLTYVGSGKTYIRTRNSSSTDYDVGWQSWQPISVDTTVGGTKDSTQPISSGALYETINNPPSPSRWLSITALNKTSTRNYRQYLNYNPFTGIVQLYGSTPPRVISENYSVASYLVNGGTEIAISETENLDNVTITGEITDYAPQNDIHFVARGSGTYNNNSSTTMAFFTLQSDGKIFAKSITGEQLPKKIYDYNITYRCKLNYLDTQSS